jgi:hypothetical protein
MMKSLFQKYPRTTLGLALLLTVAALTHLGLQIFSSPKRPKNLVYFYNLKTKTLFAASDRLLPPIRTESGPDTGVKAYVYTCDSRNDPSKRVIAYLEKMTPEGQRAAAQALKDDNSGIGLGLAMDKLGASILVRRPQDEMWYPRNSPQGLAIMEAGMKSCGSDHPIICLP